MAAQERAKQAKPKEELPPPDFFSAPPPAESLPPPSFDEAALPPPVGQQQAHAPPAFSMLVDAFDMEPPPMQEAAAPNYSTAPLAPPAVMPSAPAFEDMLSGAPSAPLLDGMEQLLPPPMPADATQQQSDFADDFAGLEGMSEEEKQALLEEQRRIMEQIEQNKPGTATAALSAADAFDQRSNAAVARVAGGEPARVRLPGAASSINSASATSSGAQRTVKLGENQEVALHGQERTRAAIKDGTAILVQCVNCNNWMQVTDNATLMFCPVCQVVSPVDRENAVTTKEEALQMEADRKLAEELQKEEYTAAERAERRQTRARQQQAQAETKQGESWWDWLGLGGAEAAPARPQPQAQQAPQYRGDMGVSRPPGAGGGASSLQGVQTGEERTINYANSGSYDAEDRRLLAGPGGARVAEAKPLFACVADSITTAASSFSTALQTQNLTSDDEGNVHGVDGSSLLVVSQAGRNQSHS